MLPMTEQRIPVYSLAELASLGGVTPRTLRFYLTEGLLPAPLGRGRGKHYDDAHLTRLRDLQHCQAKGLELSAIKRLFDSHYATEALNRGEYPPAVDLDTEAEAVPEAPEQKVSTWSRLELAPGVELHVSSHHRLPPAFALAQVRAELLALVGHSETEREGRANEPD